jgi:hypothetical protein
VGVKRGALTNSIIEAIDMWLEKGKEKRKWMKWIPYQILKQVKKYDMVHSERSSIIRVRWNVASKSEQV